MIDEEARFLARLALLWVASLTLALWIHMTYAQKNFWTLRELIEKLHQMIMMR